MNAVSRAGELKIYPFIKKTALFLFVSLGGAGSIWATPYRELAESEKIETTRILIFEIGELEKTQRELDTQISKLDITINETSPSLEYLRGEIRKAENLMKNFDIQEVYARSRRIIADSQEKIKKLNELFEQASKEKNTFVLEKKRVALQISDKQKQLEAVLATVRLNPYLERASKMLTERFDALGYSWNHFVKENKSRDGSWTVGSFLRVHEKIMAEISEEARRLVVEVQLLLRIQVLDSPDEAEKLIPREFRRSIKDARQDLFLNYLQAQLLAASFALEKPHFTRRMRFLNATSWLQPAAVAGGLLVVGANPVLLVAAGATALQTGTQWIISEYLSDAKHSARNDGSDRIDAALEKRKIAPWLNRALNAVVAPHLTLTALLLEPHSDKNLLNTSERFLRRNYFTKRLRKQLDASPHEAAVRLLEVAGAGDTARKLLTGADPDEDPEAQTPNNVETVNCRNLLLELHQQIQSSIPLRIPFDTRKLPVLPTPKKLPSGQDE